jgi:hypothetical protein
MTLEGVDYSAGRLSSLALKDNGLSFVCRYVSTAGNAKNLTAAEVADWSANGIGIVVVFEQGAQNALGGGARGTRDATTAQSQLDALGLSTAPVYFAVDFDATADQLPTVSDYLTGAAGVIGPERTGVYGSHAVVQYALDEGAARYAWQTYAWSHRELDPRAHLYQYHNDERVAGVAVDRDRTVSSDEDYGQFRVPSAKPEAPDVTEVWPASGDPAGGTMVTISGSGLATATDVGFGGVNAGPFTVDSDSQLTATSPGGEGTVDVTVVTPSGTSAAGPQAQFTYESVASRPEVTLVSPDAGDAAGGTTVTITGWGFADVTGVGFGDVEVSDMSVDSDTQIDVVSPAGEGTVDVTVVTADSTSASGPQARFTYTA